MAVSLRDCPPGLFLFDGTLCFKSEYMTESMSQPGVWQSDAYVVESGEYFWGGVSDPVTRENLEVNPLDCDAMTAAAIEAERSADTGNGKPGAVARPGE